MQSCVCFCVCVSVCVCVCVYLVTYKKEVFLETNHTVGSPLTSNFWISKKVMYPLYDKQKGSSLKS